MASLLALRMDQVQRAHTKLSAERRDRILRALKIATDFAVGEDVRLYWLPRMVFEQKRSTDPVTINNRWSSGWKEKNNDPLYHKALEEGLGHGFYVKIRKTAIVRRSYIEVSYVPQEVGSADYVLEPSSA